MFEIVYEIVELNHRLNILTLKAEEDNKAIIEILIEHVFSVMFVFMDNIISLVISMFMLHALTCKF